MQRARCPTDASPAGGHAEIVHLPRLQQRYTVSVYGLRRAMYVCHLSRLATCPCSPNVQGELLKSHTTPGLNRLIATCHA